LAWAHLRFKFIISGFFDLDHEIYLLIVPVPLAKYCKQSEGPAIVKIKVKKCCPGWAIKGIINLNPCHL